MFNRGEFVRIIGNSSGSINPIGGDGYITDIMPYGDSYVYFINIPGIHENRGGKWSHECDLKRIPNKQLHKQTKTI